MIVRIVKMKIAFADINNYIQTINQVRDGIRHFEGCSHLDILNDVNDKTIFFSYSHWESEEHLENYRHSEFFKSFWPTLKQWFSEKPLAWSVTKIA